MIGRKSPCHEEGKTMKDKKEAPMTGKEAGILLLRTLEDQLLLFQGKLKSPRVDEGKLGECIGQLDRNEFSIYREYAEIYDTIIKGHDFIRAMTQQFYNGYNKYILALKSLVRAEEYFSIVSQFPLIMTEKKYRENKMRYEKIIRTIPAGLSFMILEAARYYCILAKDIPAPIRKAMDDTKKEPVKRKRILDAHAQYIGPDGQQADKLTAILEEAAGGADRRTMLYYKTLFHGGDALKKLYKERTGKPLPKGKQEHAARLFHDMTSAAERGRTFIPRRLDSARIVCALFPEPVSITCKPAEALTKREALKTVAEDYDGHFKEFVKDYPALYEALLDDLRQHFPSYEDDQDLTWGDLADARYLDFDDRVTIRPGMECKAVDAIIKNHHDLLAWDRAMNHGIAIYKGDEYRDPTKDADDWELMGGLDYYLKAEDGEEKLEEMQDNITLIALPAMRFMYAYNALLDAIGEAYDAPFLKSFYSDVKIIDDRIENADEILYSLYRGIYGTGEEKARKRALLLKYFTPLEDMELKPTEAALENLKERIESAKGRPHIVHFLMKNYERLIVSTMREGEKTAWAEALKKHPVKP